MEVFVRNTISDELEVIEASVTDTPEDLKQAVADLFDVPEESVKLQLNGEDITAGSLEGLSGGEEIIMSISSEFHAQTSLKQSGYSLDSIKDCIKAFDIDNFVHFVTLGYCHETVVTLVCDHGFVKGMQLLLHEKELKYANEHDRFTIMRKAASSPAPTAHDVVSLLLDHNYPTIIRPDRQTALRQAASTGTIETVKVLVERTGGDPDVHSYDGACALSEAIHSKHREKVDYLANLYPHRCNTSLSASCQIGSAYCIRLVLGMGTPLDPSSAGCDLMRQACNLGNESCVAYLLWLGASYDSKDAAGLTPVMAATRMRNHGAADLIYATRKMHRLQKFEEHKSDLFRKVDFTFDAPQRR